MTPRAFVQKTAARVLRTPAVLRSMAYSQAGGRENTGAEGLGLEHDPVTECTRELADDRGEPASRVSFYMELTLILFFDTRVPGSKNTSAAKRLNSSDTRFLSSSTN